MSDTMEEIRRLLEPILESMGLSLWDMDFQKHGPQWLLRIFIDREPGGVTLDDCESVSRDLSATLDVEDIVPHAYRLEVSSPGLDRSLTKPEHFVRFAGHMIKVKTYQPINGQKVLRGTLRGLEGATVGIESETGGLLHIALSDIAKATLEVEF